MHARAHLKVVKDVYLGVLELVDHLGHPGIVQEVNVLQITKETAWMQSGITTYDCNCLTIWATQASASEPMGSR